MPELLSGSRLPIARHCKYSFREDVTFPRNRAPDDDEDAREGHRNHELYSAFVETGGFPPLTPSQRVLCGHVKEFWGSRGRWGVETAYALNPRAVSVRHLGNRINRAYGELSPDEIPLTIDYEGYDNGTLVVGDWKGFGAHVAGPAENLQLLAGACAVALYANQQGRPMFGPVRVEVAHVTEEGVWCPSDTISSLKLSAVMQELVAIQEAIKQKPDAKSGDHCRYCEVNGACPYTSAAVAKVAPASSAPPVWTSEFVSAENDRALIRELGATKKAIEAIERALKGRAAGEGIDMGDGTVFKPIVCKRTVPDTKAIEAHLGEQYLKFTKLIEYEQYRRVKR